MKWPSKYQWSQFLKISSKKEIITFFTLVAIFVLSIVGVAINYYFKNSVLKPAIGGNYREGLVGAIHFLNPILASANDVDRDISKLIFSGLLKYDGNGNLTPDLAESYNIQDNGKTYEIKLKSGVYWHDQKPFNADDVIFTIITLQDPEYRSPERKAWEGIIVEKGDDLTVRFKLKNPYAPFLQKLTLGILPKHIWETVQPDNFALNENNLKPVGTGPYQFESIEKTKSGAVKSIKLKIHKQHFAKAAYIEHVSFIIYPTQDDALKALNDGGIDGLGLLSAQEKNKLADGITTYSLSMPLYYAIYFNTERNKSLAEKSVRQALAQAINKSDILKNILLNEGAIVDSPLPQNIFGESPNIVKYNFNLEEAKKILEQAGWVDKNNDGIREKSVTNDKKVTTEVPLQITLTTVELPELEKVAQYTKDSWQKIGVMTNIITINTGSIQGDIIKPRDYQALLFGNILRLTADPYSFWHSSQKRDPGLNLSLYENKTVDGILLDARQDMNPDTRKQKLDQFQKIVTEDLPAIFLYNPNYLYAVSNHIKGIEIKTIPLPADRFSQIANWYISMERKLK